MNLKINNLHKKIKKIIFLIILLIFTSISAQGIGFDDDVDDETEPEVKINLYIVPLALVGLGYVFLSFTKNQKH